MSVNQSEFIKRYSIIKNLTDTDLYDKNIYILGSSERGKINEPILIENNTQLEKYFGVQGSLYNSYNAITLLKPDANIYVCKVTGEYGYITLKLNNEDIVLRTKEADIRYNDLYITIEQNSITFHIPSSIKDTSITYSFDDYKYLGNLIQKINSDTENGLNYIYIETDINFFTELKDNLYKSNPSTIHFSEVDNGLSFSKDNLYEYLKTTYETLEGFDIDIVCAVDAYLDDLLPEDYDANFYIVRDYLTQNNSFYDLLLKFCINQFTLGFKTQGIIGLNEINSYALSNLSLYIKEIEKCLKDQIKDNYYTFLISVTAGDMLYGEHSYNSHLAYAALISKTISIVSLTNIKADNASLITEFNSENLKSLKDIGVCAFRYSYYKEGPVIYSGITSKVNHDLHYICNKRMIATALNLIKRQTENVLGEVYNIDNLKALYINLLDYLKDKKVVNEYYINLTLNEDYIVIITISLKTIYMDEFVKTTNTLYLGE